MKYLLVAIFASALVHAALCPNVCSGHGTCTKAGTCTCNPTYTGGTCPYGRPYVDPSFVNEKVEPNDHNFMECSGQGECDRLTGLCVCHKGYEGSSCGRLACPNGCSGHGVCTGTRYLDNEGTQYYQKDGTTDYSFWDKEQSHVCFCDEEYTGYDCSMKKCPYGYMATSDCDELPGGNTQTIDIDTTGGTGNSGNNIYLAYIKYTDPFGREWFSDYFDVTHANATVFYDKDPTSTDIDAKIKATIPGWKNVVNSFPPGVLNVDNVVVYKYDSNVIAENMDGVKDDGSDKEYTSTKVQVQITYGDHQTGRQGENIEIITPAEVGKKQSGELSYHGLSSDPKDIVKGLLGLKDGDTVKYYVVGKTDKVTVNNLTDGKTSKFTNPDLPSPTPCAQNGKCNPATGLCECFQGFYGLACTQQVPQL